MNYKFSNKTSILLFIIIPVIIYGVFLFISFQQYKDSIRQDEAFFQQQQVNLVKSDKTRETKRFEVVISDLNLLKNLPGFKNFISDDSETNKKALQNVFYEFSFNRKIYDQIRYIDSFGQEIIRINYSNDESVIVEDALLQNKKGRYYFDQSFIMSEGQVYLSVLDLNIEQDKIEEPYKPMLRIATPIFEGKEKKGILILNYLAQEIINELDVDVVLGQGDYGKPELLNTDGYWLSSNIPEREWGFMFEDKQDLTLTKINPTLWNLIKSNSEGQVLLSDGLYTFSTIVPIDNFNLEWKLYRFIPNSILYEESNKVKDRLIYFNIVIILLLFLAVTLNIVFFSKVIKGSIAQKKYQYLFNNSQEAIMTISPPDWKFTDGNPATIKLFGLKDGEQLKIITPGDLSPQYQPNGELSSDKAREMIQKALDNGFHTFDWVHKKINGEEFSAVVTLNKVQVNDEVFLQGMVRDVTDEKKQEELLRKSVNETAKALAESERLNKSMTGRELAMIELKKKNRELEEKLKNIKLRL